MLKRCECLRTGLIHLFGYVFDGRGCKGQGAVPVLFPLATNEVESSRAAIESITHWLSAALSLTFMPVTWARVAKPIVVSPPFCSMSIPEISTIASVAGDNVVMESLRRIVSG